MATKPIKCESLISCVLLNIFCSSERCKYFAALFLMTAFSILLTTNTNAASPSDKQKMEAAHQRNDQKSVLKYAQEVLRYNEDPDALKMLGYVYGRLNTEKSKEFYSRALKGYVKAAEQGEWIHYESASQMSVDDSEKKRLHHKFIDSLKVNFEKNDPTAIFIMSTCYHSVFDTWNCKISNDKQKRQDLLTKSADLGNEQALIWLGEYYFNARNENSKNYSLAKSYLIKAHQQSEGYSLASTYLALMYIDEKNLKEAIKILKVGANYGSDDAQRILGQIYNGEHGDEYLNLPVAFMLASASGSGRFFDFRDKIYKEMKNDERLIALSLDARCAEKDYFECDQFIIPLK